MDKRLYQGNESIVKKISKYTASKDEVFFSINQ